MARIWSTGFELGTITPEMDDEVIEEPSKKGWFNNSFKIGFILGTIFGLMFWLVILFEILNKI
jgi:hypothetical protein